MGQTISGLKETLQQDAEKEKRANDALNSLQNLANTKLDNFYTQITSPHFDSSLIPIDMVIDRGSVLKCSVSEQVGPIAGEINDMFSDFASGDIGAGISKILSSGLKLLFGNYSANSSQMTKYTIACGDLGGVYRLDMHMFAYQYTSEQLTSIAKNVLAVSVVMSSVDMSKINDNTLRTIIQKCYAGLGSEEMTKIFNQIKRNMSGGGTNAASLDNARFFTSSAGQRPPRHALQRSFKLGLARSNGRFRAHMNRDGSDPSPPNMPPIYVQHLAATVLLTFDIGQASRRAEAMSVATDFSLTSHFRGNLLAQTAPVEDDTADQQLVLTVDAVRYLVGDEALKPDSMFLIHKLDRLLHDIVNAPIQLIPLISYRFLLGAEDDTPGESSVVSFKYPVLAARRKKLLAETNQSDVTVAKVAGRGKTNGHSTATVVEEEL